MNKLNWKEIQDLIGEPVYDNQSDRWRVIDSYKYEDNIQFISFTDIDFWKNFDNIELYKEKFVQEKEKMLTEEEKEFLKVMKEVRIDGISAITRIDNDEILIKGNGNLSINYIPTKLFKNLEKYEDYTLEELGLD